MIDHLTDIASDLSAFHRIDDLGEMEAAVFFALAYRLPAYRGAMAAVVARQREEQDGGTRPQSAQGQRYERTSQPAVTPRTAGNAPPATAASLTALNTELGATWFSVRTVSAADIAAAEKAEYPDSRSPVTPDG